MASASRFFTANTPGYQLTIDREKSKKLGVTISDVATALRTYMGSAYVNDFTLYGRNFRVVAQADTSYRGDIANLGQYYVRNAAGSMVPLSSRHQLPAHRKRAAHLALQPVPLGRNQRQRRPRLQLRRRHQGPAGRRPPKSLPQGYGYEFSGLSREEILAGGQTGLHLRAVGGVRVPVSGGAV